MESPKVPCRLEIIAYSCGSAFGFLLQLDFPYSAFPTLCITSENALRFYPFEPLEFQRFQRFDVTVSDV